MGLHYPQSIVINNVVLYGVAQDFLHPQKYRHEIIFFAFDGFGPETPNPT